MSEFHLGIAIINMDGSDYQKARKIAQLLYAYDIPCIVVLDRNAEDAARDRPTWTAKQKPLSQTSKRCSAWKRATSKITFPSRLLRKSSIVNFLRQSQLL